MVLFSSLAVLVLSGLAVADTCNEDNCLRALKAIGSRAVTSFCSDYTDYNPERTTLPPPTFVPSTCGSQRVSSACYCADNIPNPTYTPIPCGAGQMLQNPSFYNYLASDVDIRPWVIAVPSGAPGCYPMNGYSTAYSTDHYSIECQFGTTGGKSTVTQDVYLCPSTQYTFTIHTACDFWTSTGDFGIKFRVTLNGQVIIPTQSACPICADPNNPDWNEDCRYEAAYETANATFTSPASANKHSLVIEVTQASDLVGQQVPLLMDSILINSIGNTDVNDPAVP
ncbi:hypothetical protein HD806DRAFT_488348 [Xylariaceae sp. AK1471]|nr:hypothetical protein HD806DRAFT_488348 [Xylariaceae sp. AK1471]